MADSYIKAKRTDIQQEPHRLHFANDLGDRFTLLLQADGKLQVALNGKEVRMSVPEVALIRELLA